MITKLFIENYRSIQKAELPLGKINILTGANNSGKSSVLYAALTLKSLVSNPNRSLDAILTLPFINLGGFEQIVHLKDGDQILKLGVETNSEGLVVEYLAFLNAKKSELYLNGISPLENDVSLEISFPYPSNKLAKTKNIALASKVKNEVNAPADDHDTPLSNAQQSLAISLGQMLKAAGMLPPVKPLTASFEVSWNGFNAETKVIDDGLKIGKSDLIKIDKFFNSPVNEINKIDFTPNQRGFTQAFFGAVPLQNQITTQEEIATLIATDHDLASLIEYYFEKIVNKTFRVDFTLGTANFYLRTRDKQTGFTTDLVNEGTGINQLVTILAKTLKKGSDFICIDEPEIHLHPTYISRLAKVLVEIAENENKQFLISTHSEHLVSSLLNLLITKDLKPDDLHVFYCSKKGKSTEIEQQEVNDKGQIAGGFKSFIDAELDNLATLFKIAK
ncbi:MAG: ATP-binding protein [Saprospiraceae bacterium]|nr:ATP-binding protein [Saprospiraceae bacterium]